MLGKVNFMLIIAQSWNLLAHGAKVGYSLSPETYGQGVEDDLVDWAHHPCKRECRDYEPPLTCRYAMTIEMYTTMSHACYMCPFVPEDCFRPHCVPGAGTPKIIHAANRQVPGLAIEVCQGDRVIIDVTNKMITDTTTVHWHGIHQHGTPFMDGVPYITQCPILPGGGFRYDFIAKMAGTFYWHSHSVYQRLNGLYGAFIIRPSPKNNKLIAYYDRDEHVIVVSDWFKRGGAEIVLLKGYNNIDVPVQTILVNGLGRNNGKSKKSRHIPLPVFEVEQGYRYRFRTIHAGAQSCPMQISIDNHPLLLTSTDGVDFEPVEADAFRFSFGERYDFVIDANQRIGNYWIRFTGDNEDSKVYQYAILRYKGALEIEPEDNVEYCSDSFTVLNSLDLAIDAANVVPISSLKSLDARDAALTRKPDYKFYLGITFDLVDNEFFKKNLYGINQVPKDARIGTPKINHISYKGANFSLLTQPELIKPNLFCNETTVWNCKHKLCGCTHVLEVEYGSVVEVIMIDTGSKYHFFNHPMHLHGYYYRVVAMGKVNQTVTVEQVKELDRRGKIHRNLLNPPSKDTLGIPSGGYAVLRFYADNVGYWYFHCHIDRHMAQGMDVTFKVGDYDQFPEVPEHFPKCNLHNFF